MAFPPGRHCLISAKCHERTWTFELSQGDGPAWIRLGSWRLTHRERPDPWLQQLDRQLQQSDLADPEERLRHALKKCGAVILSCRWRSTRPPLQTWPDRVRLGMPGSGHLLPCDVERVGLDHGTRTLIKREYLEGASLAARKRDWQDAGLACAEQDGVGFAAASRQTVERALHFEAVLANPNATEGDKEHASYKLALLLGYPACCIDAYLRLGAHDDRSLAEAHDGQKGPAEAGFLVPALSLLSHVPCHAGCGPSLKLGATLLSAVDQRSPGFAELWRSVARGVWALDNHGVGWVKTDTHLYRFDPRADDPCALAPSLLTTAVRWSDLLKTQRSADSEPAHIIATMDHS